jgi:hypothetical protein
MPKFWVLAVVGCSMDSNWVGSCGLQGTFGFHAVDHQGLVFKRGPG